MNLQLFADEIRVGILLRPGLYFLANGGKTNQRNLVADENNEISTIFYAEDDFEYSSVTTFGVNPRDVAVTKVSGSDNEYNLSATNITGISNSIYVNSRLKKAYFHVTEPVNIVINDKKETLLQTIQPSYGKTGAVNGLIERAPYELEMNDAVKSLIKQGILIEAEPPT